MRIVGSIGLYRHALRELPRSEIPEILRQFLCVEDFKSDIEILKLDPHELNSKVIKNTVYKFNKLNGIKCNWWSKNKYPPINVLWPNPILHNSRLAPRNSTSNDIGRLANLCNVSSSHGISLDYLDSLYIDFVKARDNARSKWDEMESKIREFAYEVTKKWIVEWRMEKLKDIDNLEEMFSGDRLEKLKCPPTVHDKWVRILVNRWKTRYFDLYSPGMLSKYLKGHVTLAMLERESYETGESISEVKFTSDKNPCYKKPSIEDDEINGDFWDFQGVGNQEVKTELNS